MTLTIDDLPKYHQLVKYVIRAVDTLGDSAKKPEITNQVLEDFPNSEEYVKVCYANRPNDSVLVERIS